MGGQVIHHGGLLTAGDDLTVTIPGGTLTADNASVHIWAHLYRASGDPTWALSVGGQSVSAFDSPIDLVVDSNTQEGMVEVIVQRDSSTTARVNYWINSQDENREHSNSVASQDWTTDTDVVLSCDTDGRFYYSRAEYFPAVS